MTWLRTKKDINCFLARWLNEIEEFRFDVEHVPGRLNPADPLSRIPAATPESVDHPSTTVFAPFPAAVPDAQVQLVSTEQLSTDKAMFGIPSLQPSSDFLSPAFIASWQREMPLDPFFAPILKGATVHVGGLVDCKPLGLPVVPGLLAIVRLGAPSCFAAECSTVGARARRIAYAYLRAAISAETSSASATTHLSGGISADVRLPCWCVASPFGQASAATWNRTFALATLASARKRSMWGLAGCSILFLLQAAGEGSSR